MKPDFLNSKTNTRSYLTKPLFWIVVGVRIVLALYILVNPLRGFILTILADYFDAFVWVFHQGMSWRDYKVFDKLVDNFSYFMMLVVSINYPGFIWLAILLCYRLIGYMLYFKFRNNLLFLAFPNLFEVGFVWLVLLPVYFKVDISSSVSMAYLTVLLIIKIAQELIIHYPGYLPFRKPGYPVIMQIYHKLRGINGQDRLIDQYKNEN